MRAAAQLLALPRQTLKIFKASLKSVSLCVTFKHSTGFANYVENNIVSVSREEWLWLSACSMSKIQEELEATALVLVGYFNLPDACCKCNTVERKESKRLLRCQKETFLAQLLIVPHWICTFQIEKDLWVGGQLGHSMIDFDVREVRSGDQQNFQRAAFDLFRTFTGPLRDISEGQRCPRKLDILQKRNS